MLNYNDVISIEKIRLYLNKVGYDLLFQRINGYLNYYVNPWSSYDEIKYNLQSYNRKIQNLFKLLLLSEEVTYKDAIDIIDSDFIENLFNVINILWLIHCPIIQVEKMSNLCTLEWIHIVYPVFFLKGEFVMHLIYVQVQEYKQYYAHLLLKN